MFATWASSATHYGQGRDAVWCKGSPGDQDVRVRRQPDRFFVPPYVGVSGWIGVWVDGDVDWDDVREILQDAWRLTAPKRLVKALDASP
jgi:hypothetical protein